MKSPHWVVIVGLCVSWLFSAEEIPPEKFQKLKELYEKAHSHSVGKAYDKANDSLKELLSCCLPRRSPWI